MTNSKQNKQLTKSEDWKDKVDSMAEAFTTSINFSNNRIVEEYLELIEKNQLAPKEEKRMNEILSDIKEINSFKNGLCAASIGRSNDLKTITTIRSNLVEEYSCKTTIEIMLADRIVASYWRAMLCDKISNRLIEKEDRSYSFDQLTVNIIKELNKSIEFANRQLNTNIILLKELKQPKLDVKVNTKNAFISHNQQFNTGKQNEEK